MKKFVSAICAMFAILSVNAAQPIEFEVFSTKLTHKTQCALFSEHPFAAIDDNNPNKVYIFDGAMNLVKTFTIDPGREGEIEEIDRSDKNMSGYLTEVVATQHFFNDDDLYEVIVRVKENEDEWGQLYWVFNENGELLGELPFPYPAFHLADNGVWYLYTSEYNDGDNDWGYYAFALPKGRSNVNEVKRDNVDTLAITPNPADVNEQIFITLPENMSQTQSVRIFDISGNLLCKYECNSGEKVISVPAYRLSVGVNPIVVIDEEGNIIGTGKAVRK